MTDPRSFGSSQHPSGQFQKVSIGIVIDKCPKTGPRLGKEDTVALSAGGRTVSCQAVEEITRPGFIQSLERNRSHDGEDSEALARVNRASVLQSEDGVHKKFVTAA